MNEGAIELSKNKYEIDMCNGTIMDKLVSFAIPLMVSGILQLMFNAVDIIVVEAVTVRGTEGRMCDALSTALFVMGAEQAELYWREQISSGAPSRSQPPRISTARR